MVTISNESNGGNLNETYVFELVKEELPSEKSAEVSVVLADELPAEEQSGCCGKLVSKCREVGDQMKDPIQKMSHKGMLWIRKKTTFQTIKETLPIVTWLPKYRYKHISHICRLIDAMQYEKLAEVFNLINY